MKRSLVQHLVCPSDGGSLTLDITEMDAEEVMAGTLRSAAGRVYPIRRGVPRFVDADAYTMTFSRQRQHVREHFDTYRREFDDAAAADLFRQSTGFDLSDVGGWNLDAGCGYGRFLRVVDRAGGEVVGVDLSSESVELAFDFVGRARHVHIVQANLTGLPFRRDHFRRAFSIGVLHHTPDTHASFRSVLPYVQDGGEIAIWVYAPEYKVASNVWRKLTTRLPLGVVYAWCIVNEAVFAWVRALPRGGGRFGAIVPGGSLGTPFWQRVMSDFDDLTPQYAHTHSREELTDWFRDAALVDVVALQRPTSVRGRKPDGRSTNPATASAERLMSVDG